MSGFFTELKRRSVVKIAIVYAVVAWLLVQVVTAVKAPLHLPPWFDTAVIVLLAIGFPIALIIAWAFERTPEGVRRTVKALPKTAPADGEPAEAPALEVPVDQESVAVLPFVNMSSDPEQDYFSDGISEELLNQLAKVHGLHVAGRTSSFQFKGHVGDIADIARKLKVAHVLEGSVRKAGDRVRVTAQLIRADNGYHLWSETYDRELDDIFAIQEDIAHAVTDALSITLGVGELKVGTRNVAAYDAYLAGCSRRSFGTPEGWSDSVRFLQKATTLDPEFVDAHVMLAMAARSMQAVSVDRLQEMAQVERDAVARASALAPDGPGVLCVLGTLHLYDEQVTEAGRQIEGAARRAPNDSLVLQTWAWFLGEVGRARDCMSAMRQLERIEPLSVSAGYWLGLAHEVANDLEAAATQYAKVGKAVGDVNAAAGPALAVALTRGDQAEIESGIDKVLANDLGVAGHEELTAAMRDHLDDPAGALDVLRDYVADIDRWSPLMRSVVALWASYFGDDALALEAYRSLRGSRGGSALWLTMWRPLHRNMRQLPGFKDLLRDIGIADYWHETGYWGDYVRPVGEDDFECFG